MNVKNQGEVQCLALHARPDIVEVGTANLICHDYIYLPPILDQIYVTEDLLER